MAEIAPNTPTTQSYLPANGIAPMCDPAPTTPIRSVPSLLGEKYAWRIAVEDKKSRDEFVRAWNNTTSQPNFKAIMKDAMRRRKGSLTKSLRDELYQQLRVRKYHRGSTLQEKEYFIKELQIHTHNDAWRTSESDGMWDPWGSLAVHAAISKAIFGVHYIPSDIILLSLDLAAFIFYVLTLAMEDRNLQGNERLTLAGELEEMSHKIVEWEPYMKRIAIKCPDAYYDKKLMYEPDKSLF